MGGKYLDIDKMIKHYLIWRSYRSPKEETDPDIEEFNTFEELRRFKRKRLFNSAEHYKMFNNCRDKKRLRLQLVDNFMKNYPKNEVKKGLNTKMDTVGKYNWDENKYWYQKR